MVVCALIAAPLLAASCVRESPAFLLNRGKQRVAEASLRAALAGDDAQPVPPGWVLVAPKQGASGDLNGDATDGKSVSLLRQPLLGQLAVVSLSWAAINLLYYGLGFAVGSCDPADGCNKCAISAAANPPDAAVVNS